MEYRMCTCHYCAYDTPSLELMLQHQAQCHPKPDGPAPRLATLEARSPVGEYQIAEAKRRLRHWDGRSWSVVQERPSVTFSDLPGPWLHLVPHTTESTDWLSRWVSVSADVNFVVTLVDDASYRAAHGIQG